MELFTVGNSWLKKITFIERLLSQMQGWKVHEELLNILTLPLTQEILEMWISEG